MYVKLEAEWAEPVSLSFHSALRKPSFGIYANVLIRVSEWLLFNAISAIVQQYYGKNTLIFNEMMKMSSLF
jgi:hypothetical protein